MSFQKKNSTLTITKKIEYRNHIRSVLIVYTIILLFTPLTKYFSYEFCAAETIIFSFAGGLLFISGYRKNPTYRRFVKDYSSFLLSLFAIPMILQGVHSVFSGSAALLHGIKFYCILAMPAIFVGGGIASYTLLMTKKRPYALFILLYMVILALPISVLYIHPQIYFYNPIIGYFPGTIYDELIRISGSLLIYSILNTLVSILLIVLLFRSYRKKYIVSALIFIAFVGPIFIPFSPFVTSHSTLETYLNGRIDTPHFVIHYKVNSIDNAKAKYLGLLHEVYYEELKEFYKETPAEKINSYIFATAEEKSELLGTKNAEYAKPWLFEMYMSAESLESTLKHELSHVFSSTFGYSPFLLSNNFNPSLLEGAASASSQIYDDYAMNYLSYQALMFDTTLNVQSVFKGLNFFVGASSVSYCVSGAFVRYLIKAYGIDRFKVLYHDGFNKNIYGKNIAELEQEFITNLKKQGFTYNQDVATYYFGRRGLFQKTSPHFVAEQETEIVRLVNEKKYDQALLCINTIKKISHDPSINFLEVTIYKERKQYQAALDILDEMEKEYRNTAIHYGLVLKLAEMHELTNNFQQANFYYNELMEHAPIPMYANIAQVRLLMLSDSLDSIQYIVGDLKTKYEIITKLLARTENPDIFPVLISLSKELNIPYFTFKGLFLQWFEHRKVLSGYATLIMTRYALENSDIDVAQKVLERYDARALSLVPGLSEERKKIRIMERLLEEKIAITVEMKK